MTRMTLRSKVYNLLRDVEEIDGVKTILFCHLCKHGLQNNAEFVVSFARAGGFIVEQVGAAINVRTR